MARRYVRDKRGRFASKGGGASAGKMGKSEKNTKARAKYKEASGKARAATKFASSISKSKGAGSKDAKFFNRQAAGAKSGLTRVTKGLRGGKSGNLGATTKKASSKRATTKRATPTRKAPTAKRGMSNQVAAGRAARAAYRSQSASKRKAARKRKGGSFTQTSTFANSLKNKQAKARDAKKRARRK